MRLKNFWIRLKAWEYWPTSVVYIPVFTYYVYLSLKARSGLFFTRVNPFMRMGGLYSASKYEALRLLPQALYPKTLLIQPQMQGLAERLKAADLDFPLILKPDTAERGVGIELVRDQAALERYHQNSKVDYLIQAYMDYPFEAGLFVWRNPDTQLIEVPSIVLKGFLAVEGDGQSNLKTLIFQQDRARLVWPRLSEVWKAQLDSVPAKGEKIYLEPIGNHNRGTCFLDGRDLICPEIQAWVSQLIDKHLPQYNYGRFDLRAPSKEAFIRGEVKILEINGVNAEPAHIYTPGFSLMEGWRTLIQYWRMIYRISEYQGKQGVKPRTWAEAWQAYHIWRQVR